jgi:hypothetical protein
MIQAKPHVKSVVASLVVITVVRSPTDHGTKKQHRPFSLSSPNLSLPPNQNNMPVMFQRPLLLPADQNQQRQITPRLIMRVLLTRLPSSNFP